MPGIRDIENKDCANDLYVACNIFLNYMKTKIGKGNEKICKNWVEKMKHIND